MVYLTADTHVCNQWIEGFYQSFGEVESRRSFIPAASDPIMDLSDTFAKVGHVLSNKVKVSSRVLKT